MIIPPTSDAATLLPWLDTRRACGWALEPGARRTAVEPKNREAPSWTAANLVPARRGADADLAVESAAFAALSCRGPA